MGTTYDIFHLDPKLKDHKLMTIKLDKDTVLHNDDLKGTITLNLIADITLTDIILIIKMSEGWVYTIGSENNKSERNEMEVAQFALNIRQRLMVNTELVSLRPGEHSFPFLLRIPYLQPSFELPTTKYRGYIRYTLEAKTLSPLYVISGDHKFIIQSQPLMVQSPLVLSASSEINQLLYLSKGNVTMSCLLPRNDFVYGENIPITITVDNTQGNMDFKQVKIRLMRKFGFNHKQKKTEEGSYEKVLSHEYYPLECKCGNKNTQVVSVLVRDQDHYEYTYGKTINPYPQYKNTEMFLPTVHSPVLRCNYYLKVTGYFSSFVIYAKRPRIEFNISIVHQSFVYRKEPTTFIQPNSQPQPFYQQPMQYNPPQQMSQIQQYQQPMIPQQQMMPQSMISQQEPNNIPGMSSQSNCNPYPNYPQQNPQYPNNTKETIITPSGDNTLNQNIYSKPIESSMHDNNNNFNLFNQNDINQYPDYNQINNNINDYPEIPSQDVDLPPMPSNYQATKNEFNLYQ